MYHRAARRAAQIAAQLMTELADDREEESFEAPVQITSGEEFHEEDQHDLLPPVNEDGDHTDDYLYEIDAEYLHDMAEGTESDSSSEEERTPNIDLISHGQQWTRLSTGERSGRAPRRNVFQERIGVRRGINPRSPYEAFLMFFEDIILESTRFTNLEGRRLTFLQNRNLPKFAPKKHWKSVSDDEMKAFFGLHIIGGIFKARHRSLETLWSERDGLPAYRATMSLRRFKEIKRCFRVDDRTKRDAEDPLSPVRNVWTIFNQKLGLFYDPEPCLTIDEQLVEFHGNVKFRIYIPSKPGSYGMKIIWLNEASTGYALAGLPYIGAKTLSEDEKSNMSLCEASVMKVASSYLGRAHNITCDNWFTTCPLADKLLECRTTIVGTMRRNRKYIPQAAKSIRGRRKKCAEYFKSEDRMICSYYDKGSKPVILLSTMHSCGSNDPSGLPEVVAFYNSTKKGTDDMDHVVRLHRTGRKCRRWPYVFVFNMVDIALLNSSIISKKLNQPESDRRSNQFHINFCLDLGYELIDAEVRKHLNTNMNQKMRRAAELLGYSVPSLDLNLSAASVENRKRGRCISCDRKSDKKTTMRCSTCENFVCKKHSLSLVKCHMCS